MDDDGQLSKGNTFSYHVTPFEGSNIDQSALEFTGIKPNHPLRPAQDEIVVFKDLFSFISDEVKLEECKRAILVAHNAIFDLSFMNAAIERCKIKRSPFHPFSAFDTASLSGLALGQTVLAKACFYAGIEFNNDNAHSAAYDSKKLQIYFAILLTAGKTSEVGQLGILKNFD